MRLRTPDGTACSSLSAGQVASVTSSWLLRKGTSPQQSANVCQHPTARVFITVSVCCRVQAAPSPLHAAAAADDVSAAEAALASGCDVDLRDGEGATPLHWAADRGSLQASTYTACGTCVCKFHCANVENAAGQCPVLCCSVKTDGLQSTPG